MPNYLFDVKLVAALRFDAPDAAMARRWLSEALDCATINCGHLPTGVPLLGEASMEGEAALAEIDGDYPF